jgi:hypothetical protein
MFERANLTTGPIWKILSVLDSPFLEEGYRLL